MDGRRVACFARACCGLDTVLPGLVIVFAFVCVPFLKEHSYWSCARPYCPLKLLYLVAEWGDSVPRVGRRRPTTSRGHASFPPPRLFSSPPTPHLLTANRLVSPPIGACKKCRQTPFLYIHIPPHQKYVRYFTPPPPLMGSWSAREGKHVQPPMYRPHALGTHVAFVGRREQRSHPAGGGLKATVGGKRRPHEASAPGRPGGQQIHVAETARNARHAQRHAAGAMRRPRRFKILADKTESPAKVTMSTPRATAESGRSSWVPGRTKMHTDIARGRDHLLGRWVQPPGAGLQPPRVGGHSQRHGRFGVNFVSIPT